VMVYSRRGGGGVLWLITCVYLFIYLAAVYMLCLQDCRTVHDVSNDRTAFVCRVKRPNNSS